MSITYIVSYFLFFLMSPPLAFIFFFFFNDTATTEIYTLSLHDALPICVVPTGIEGDGFSAIGAVCPSAKPAAKKAAPKLKTGDRKSTRLNSSHQIISYAVFCLKKKKK